MKMILHSTRDRNTMILVDKGECDLLGGRRLDGWLSWCDFLLCGYLERK